MKGAVARPCKRFQNLSRSPPSQSCNGHCGNSSISMPLESLAELSHQEAETLWAQEALRRDSELDAYPASGRPSADVLRDAFAKLK
jgi:hypothetical protein